MAIHKVTKEIHFCYGHRLLDYEGKCRYLHGHNGRLEIELVAEGLDRRGMVRDFTDVKRIVGGWIDQNLDHRMILHQDDPVVPLLERMGEPLRLLPCNPTAENIAQVIFDHAAGAGLPVSEVRLWETPTSVATYRAR